MRILEADFMIDFQSTCGNSMALVLYLHSEAFRKDDYLKLRISQLQTVFTHSSVKNLHKTLLRNVIFIRWTFYTQNVTAGQ